MSFRDEAKGPASDGAAFPWILEHLLAYPGTYEIPLRTMYTLNSTTTHSQPPSPTRTTPPKPGCAFARHAKYPSEEQQNMSTATAAAHLRANLMSHIAQLPAQPSSLPPSFVTSFVRRCFPPELDQVDFPQALTALDYLKDLEVRRRREVVAALGRLGVDRHDIGQEEVMKKKYPGVMRWVNDIEEKERRVEVLYTQVYIGLRRWTLINELSLEPFNKANCIAMLNTLYPPTAVSSVQFVQPTAQLTPQILSTQRNGFFRYITAVEKNGPTVLQTLIGQGKRPGELNGWTNHRETLEKYLRMANCIIDECFEVSGRDRSNFNSPTEAFFSAADVNEVNRRKVDSGVSFSSNSGSNRDSGQSHQTRPSTSSSMSTHTRKTSKEKPLPEKPLPSPSGELRAKPAGSTLERIAREFRKIKSRGDLRESSKSRPSTAVPVAETSMTDNLTEQSSSTLVKDRKLRPKLSLRKMRSSTALKERDVNTSSSAPASRDGYSDGGDIPAFDVEEMKRKRMIWEARQKKASVGKQVIPDGSYMELDN